jgi:hypothetical protein
MIPVARIPPPSLQFPIESVVPEKLAYALPQKTMAICSLLGMNYSS